MNGVRLENFIFEGYVVVKDGRVYTAVDKLPPDLTPSLQLLKPLESLPGWLFALTEDPNKKNGFQLTGNKSLRKYVNMVSEGHSAISIFG